MGDIVREDMLELDLNQEPVESHSSILQLETFLNELETAHGEIEERIRELEAVNFRARQREQVQAPRTPISITMSSAGYMEETGNGIAARPSMVEGGKSRKRDCSHLIAKALAMEMDAKDLGSSSGGFFDCNICFDMARDPIVTCCGHLFCWSCFYQVSYVHPNAKECPVCKGEVRNTSIIPIYGNADCNNGRHSEQQECDLKVPPRPPAPRVESMRQQLLNLGSSSSRLEERIQQFNNMVGALGIGTQSHNPGAMHITAENTNIAASPLSASEMVGYQQHNSFQVSRLLLQGTASFSSLSSALDSAMVSAARLVQDLEVYIQTRRVRRSLQRSPRVDDIYSLSSIAAAMQPQISMVPIADLSSRSSRDVSTAAMNLENQTANTAINSTAPSSSSSSLTRTDVPRVPDAQNGGSRRSRRRLR